MVTNKQPKSLKPAPAGRTSPPKITKFSGKITSINLGCAHDAPTCSITVDGKEVIFMEGPKLTLNGKSELKIWGKLIGLEKLFSQKDLYIGKTVEVYATETFYSKISTYSLEGKKDFYIKLIE